MEFEPREIIKMVELEFPSYKQTKDEYYRKERILNYKRKFIGNKVHNLHCDKKIGEIPSLRKNTFKVIPTIKFYNDEFWLETLLKYVKDMKLEYQQRLEQID